MADVSKALNIVRKLSPTGFFSRATEEAQRLPQAKGTPEQMRSMLLKQGVKPDELKWTGFDDWAKGKKSVTRDEVAQFLNQNRVNVGEMTLGKAKTGYSYGSPEEWRAAIYRAQDAGDTAEEARLAAAWRAASDAGQTKFSQYTLPGGENYRELLLSDQGNSARSNVIKQKYEPALNPLIAEREALRPEYMRLYKEGPDNEFYKIKDKFSDLNQEIGRIEGRMQAEIKDLPSYRSSHWDEPDILAHLRLKDRVDPEGRRILHVEEIQSDWGQAGRRQGFAPKPLSDAEKQEATELTGAVLGNRATEAQIARLSELDARGSAFRSNVPQGPFVDSTQKWTDLALKRALTEAAGGDYAGLAVTPGREQAKRYFGDEGRAAGMIGYYDQIVPKRLQELTRPLDPQAKMSTVDVPRGNVGASGDEIMNTLPETSAMSPEQRSEWWSRLDPQARDQLFSDYRSGGFNLPFLEITPTMREKIKEGLPLFTMMPAAVGLGASQMQEGQNPAVEGEGFADGGKIVRKALEAVRGLPPAANSRLTQIATTGPSYEKALRQLQEAGVEGRALDYGAGRGHGLRSIGADTFEPYPQGWTPTYTKPEEIPEEAYRRLINLNVLNVLDPQAREAAVLNMGRVVEPGGGGVISTRGRDVMNARGEPGPEPMSLIIGQGDQARYQKGFTPRELREYVGDTLGSRFDVDPADVGQASVLFRRNREDGGRAVDVARQVLLEDQYPTHYLPNVGRQVMQDGGVPEFPVSESERNAQLNDAVSYANQLDRASRVQEAKDALAQTWPVQMAKSVVGGMALPGDVAAGRVDPTSEIGIQRALDLAGLATFGPSVVPGAGAQGAINMSLLDPSKRRPGGPFDPTATGSVFKDVKYPELNRAQNRAINSAIEMGRMEEVDLPIRSMYATQPSVNPDYASPVSSNRGNFPVVQRIGDEFFVRDGHHRLTKLAMEGKDVARVNLVDPYGSTPKDMPLLEWRPKTPKELASAAKEKADLDALYAELDGLLSGFDVPKAFGGSVGRQVMQDGGVPDDFVSAQGRRRAALEELGAFEDRPPMDPATMGQNWANAVARMKVEDYAKRPEGYRAPARPPEQSVRPLDLDWRDKVGGAIAGDGGAVRGRVAKALVGNTGMPDTGMGFGLLDFTPLGAPLAASDVATALKNEDYLGAALAPAGYAAYLARKPIGAAARWTYENAIRPTYDAGRRAVDVAGDVLGRVPAPVAAGAAGAAAMTPEEAEAGKARIMQQAIASARAMARAKELGYDTSQIWYHSALTPIDKFEPHGKFMGRSGVSGIHLTDNPEMANRYLERYGDYDYKQQPFEKNVMPVFVKTENVLKRDEPFKGQISMGNPVPESYRSPLLDMGYDALLRNEAISRRGGVKHVDPGSRGSIEGKELILTDPSQVRSIYDEYADGGSVEGVDVTDENKAGLVDRALSFISQFNPVSTAEAAKLRVPAGVKQFLAGTPENAAINAQDALKRVVSPFSEDPASVKRALEIAATYRVPQGAEFGSGSFFRKKPSMGVQDVQADVVPLPGATPRAPRPLSWEEFGKEAKGGTLINVGGDRLNLGVLRDINNDKRMAWEVPLHAGPKYMLEPNPGLVWANAPGHTTSFNNIIADAAKRGPVYGVYAPMGPTAVDSSVGMFDAVMSQIPPAKITRAAAKEFDDMVRSGAFTQKVTDRPRTAEAMAEIWPGIAKLKDQSAVLALANKMTGTQRSDLIKAMEASAWRKKGFPEVGVTRVAVTDPALLGTPTNTIGHRVVRFDTEGKVSPTRTFEHQTYPTESLGQYVADVPLVQTQYGMPTAMEKLLSKPTKSGEIMHPYSLDPMGRSSARKMFTEQKQLQPVDDQLIESIMMGLQRQKEYGFKRGGSVSHYAMMIAKQLGSSPRETV